MFWQILMTLLYLYQIERVFYKILMSMTPVEKFVISLYEHACLQAHQPDYDEARHREAIISKLEQAKMAYRDIKKLVSYSKEDWIQDILEVTLDMKAILKNKERNLQKFMARAKMHFGGEHYEHIKQNNTSKVTRNILEMYKQGSFQWSQALNDKYTRQIYNNTVYLMGLTKGNGVIIDSASMISCAHVFVDDQTDQIFKIRCFANGYGSFGVARASKKSVFNDYDVAFAQIISFQNQEIIEVPLDKSSEFQFKGFVPIKCIQLGLLYSPDQILEPFYTSQGFIEKSLYKGEDDIELVDEMGLLVHSCYGLHGTSGSPIWSGKGELIGIHNSWNSEGYNVKMIVHDDNQSDDSSQQNECRVIRQYQRRAIASHVLKNLFEKWKSSLSKTQQKLAKKNRKSSRLNRPEQ